MKFDPGVVPLLGGVTITEQWYASNTNSFQRVFLVLVNYLDSDFDISTQPRWPAITRLYDAFQYPNGSRGPQGLRCFVWNHWDIERHRIGG
jgi:hypothetical protein